VHRSGRWPNGCRSLVNSLLVISTTSRSATWKVFGRRPKNSTRAACAPQSQSARSRVSHVFVVRNCDIICVICAIRSFNPRRTRRAGMPSGRREARKGERSGDRELKRREDFHLPALTPALPLTVPVTRSCCAWCSILLGPCGSVAAATWLRRPRRNSLPYPISPKKKFVIARPRSPAPGPGALPKQRSCCPCNGADGSSAIEGKIAKGDAGAERVSIRGRIFGDDLAVGIRIV